MTEPLFHRARRALACGMALAALFATPARAVRPPTPKILDQAQKQVDGGDFEGALITLQDGLSSPDNSNDELVQLYWRLGEVYVYLNREATAEDTFERLLYVSPRFEAPKLTSPRVRKVFERVRDRFVSTGQEVSLSVPPQDPPQPNRAVLIEARITNLRPEFSARVYFRPALTEAWQWAKLVPAAGAADRFLAKLPAFPAGSSIEYYVEIQSSDRRRVQGDGSSLSPKTLTVAGAPDPAVPLTPPPPEIAPAPWYSHAWIWGVVGAAVVAGGVLAYVALQPSPATAHLHVEVTP